MTKTEIVNKISENTGISKQEVANMESPLSFTDTETSETEDAE